MDAEDSTLTCPPEREARRWTRREFVAGAATLIASATTARAGHVPQAPSSVQTVTGPIAAELHVSCDCRDTDIWARLLDVAPDGTAFNLMSPGLDVLRASYREPEKGRQLLTPGEIYTLRLDKLITSNLFKAGHRIRLQVSASFFPNFSRNLHTGELETISDRRQKATIRIYHDTAHRSAVTLPIVSTSHTKDTKITKATKTAKDTLE